MYLVISIIFLSVAVAFLARIRFSDEFPSKKALYKTIVILCIILSYVFYCKIDKQKYKPLSVVEYKVDTIYTYKNNVGVDTVYIINYKEKHEK